MDILHIAIEYEEDFSKSIFDEFNNIVSSDILSLAIVSKEKMGPLACV